MPEFGSMAGQAAVESALVLPIAVFAILGLLQMGMIQQARLFADYAAYRGARAGSLQFASCDVVVVAELAALTPTFGRADSVGNWRSTFQKAREQQRDNKAPLVINFWEIDNPPVNRDADAPANNEDEVSHIRLHMYYLYELNIPFANWILTRAFLLQYEGLSGYDGFQNREVDPLAPTHIETETPWRTASEEMKHVLNAAVAYHNSTGRYAIPVYASWTMRMFSRTVNDAGQLKKTAINPCR